MMKVYVSINALSYEMKTQFPHSGVENQPHISVENQHQDVY